MKSLVGYMSAFMAFLLPLSEPVNFAGGLYGKLEFVLHLSIPDQPTLSQFQSLKTHQSADYV